MFLASSEFLPAVPPNASGGEVYSALLAASPSRVPPPLLYKIVTLGPTPASSRTELIGQIEGRLRRWF